MASFKPGESTGDSTSGAICEKPQGALCPLPPASELFKHAAIWKYLCVITLLSILYLFCRQRIADLYTRFAMKKQHYKANEQ